MSIQAELQRLSDGGLAAFPPGRLEDLAAGCKDWSEAVGDLSYSIVADVLRRVDDSFDPGNEALDTSTVLAFDGVFRDYLPGFLQTGPEERLRLAQAMRTEAHRVLEERRL